jgi:L-ascorbate metabolism protein UlaG (beta-lactamase superfamily)
VAPSRVAIQFIGHATALIDLGGTRVLTDPFLRTRLGPLERHGPVPRPASMGTIDIVVISHGHHDHYDRSSLAALPGRPTVVVPRGLGASVGRVVDGEVVEMTAGASIEVGGLRIDAVPARHWISPGAVRAEPLGYLLRGDTTVYFAGDTGRFPGMRDLAGVDVALLPVWTWGPHLGPGHLGPRTAAESLRDIRPAIAMPIHWGTLYPARLHHVWRRPLVEPGDRFAEHAAAIAPDVEVRVLRPGESTILE